MPSMHHVSLDPVTSDELRLSFSLFGILVPRDYIPVCSELELFSLWEYVILVLIEVFHP